MSKREYSFKLRNPYKPDEIIDQKVVLSDSLQYDYSQSGWISVDAEFLGLNYFRDDLCTIQIASEEPGEKERQRVEIVKVANKANEQLRKLFTSDKLKIFHVFKMDIPMIGKALDTNVKGPFYDTKIASKIAWTNARTFSKTEFIKSFIDPKYEQKELYSARWELDIEKWTNQMIEYASIDALYLFRMKQKLDEIAKDRGRETTVQNAMEAIEHIANVYKDGFDFEVFNF